MRQPTSSVVLTQITFEAFIENLHDKPAYFIYHKCRKYCLQLLITFGDLWRPLETPWRPCANCLFRSA